MDAIYVSNNSFKVMGDKTIEFNAGRRVKLDCQLDGIKYATVVSSSYSSPYTTIIIDESTLTASLTTVWYGIVQTGQVGSLPNHSHDGTEGSGGTLSGTTHTHPQYVTWDFGSNTISGTGDIYCNDIYTASGTVYIGDLKLSTDGTNLLVNGNEINVEQSLLDLTDTPEVYSDGKYLVSTTSGVEWTTLTVSGVDGKDGADTTISGSYIKGVQSIKVEYATASGVYINPGVVDVNNVLYENENRVTLSGSFSADTWYYVYATTSGTDLSFTMSSGIPSLDYTKMGYYNGDDRCIGFVLTDSSGDIRKYLLDGDRYNYYDQIITTINWQTLNPDTNYDFTVYTPFGDTVVFVNLYARSDTTDNAEFYIGTPGEDNQSFWGISQGTDQSVYASTHASVICDENKQLRLTATGDYFVSRVWSVGFQMPDYIYSPGNFSQLSGGGTSDVQNFLDLKDTPTSYSGTEGNYLVSTGSGIEFTMPSFDYNLGNWILVKEITLSNTTYSGSISWDGDTYPRARIETSLSKAPTSPNNFIFRFNNDSGNNYTHAYIVQNGTSVISEATISTDNMRYALGSVSANRQLFAITDLYLKSGARRHVMTRDNIYDSADTDRITGIYDNLWSNTVDNVTVFNIELRDASTGTIKIYRWQDITEIPVAKGKQSLKVEYATASGIYINPGTIHMKDSTFGMYELNDRTEVTVSGLAVDTWYYIYTNVSGSTTTLDETNFTVSSGVPSVDYSNMGYYNGNDRCIGAVYTDSSGDIIEFYSGPGNYVCWGQNFITNINNTDVNTIGSANTVYFYHVPSFSTMLNCLFATGTYNSNSTLRYGKDTNKNIMATYFHTSGRGKREERTIICNNDQTGKVWEDISTSNTYIVYVNGFYLPDYIYTGA